MKKFAPFLALALTLGCFAGSMRLWWFRRGMERYYVLDYARLTLGIPSHKLWPYRIEQVYHLSPVYVPQLFHNEPLYMVILWPLIATAVVFICSMLAAAALSGGHAFDQGRVLKGPKVISNFSWWYMHLGKKKGFYITQ